ncbi:hypothetical protein [Lactiplantibacillus plantarum]|uniref:hypothetical protein n=1 Tax=Lactiplantibacillus plantarum TaxID=1590 RepID=UPI00062D9ED0|nr:hypothetical protein [Lactiplantibacillus plantarum]EKP1542726.1 hypothetical protein [Campylobacter jejuni]DAM85576.1 MAG TPA: hypothetical protein [Caudoviricetes sp.]KLD40429.1 prophage Lp2 protein 53 [Lactiplantibacillus plantarum]KLD60039.1 prophage Lp2 protein 53 [Lactiplantibacillus plantarum]KZU34077.1 prophage Lp2 protein 53 [Lactiplantibacillus plantarum]
MAKTLEFTTKSPRQIKQGDTETTFTFICKNAGSAIDLTQATSITAKIGNDSGYLRSQSIAITSLAGLKPGWLNLQPMPTLIAGLPAGNYQLEIWVIDQAGTSIYPSDKPLGFTITNNIENESGASITTIAFDDFVEAMNKAANTIDKGDKGDDGLSAYQVAVINGYKGSQTDWLASLKGDTGTVDNAGLTTAPAFVALQTQVDNSAVGTNLLVGTATPASITGNNVTNQVAYTYALVGGMKAYDLYQKYGSTFTLSYDWSVKDTANSYTGQMQQQFLGSPWGFSDITNISSSNTSGHKVTVFNLSNSSANIATSLEFHLEYLPKTSTITVSNMKLEKGSVATDWCPNPTEILTQADYAKIKAAIVALGGTLS